MKKKVKRLELHKESLRQLDKGSQLIQAVGGAPTVTLNCCNTLRCTDSSCPHSCTC